MSAKDFALQYGHDKTVQFKIEQSNILGVLEEKEIPVIEDISRAIKEALENPVDNSAPLKEVVSSGDRIVVTVSSKERAWLRSRNFVPVLLNELNEAGIPDKHIFLIIANGTVDSSYTKEELEICCGQEAMSRVDIISHDCRNKGDLVYVGMTSRGTPVHLNRHFVEADKRILTGGIAFHYMPGFSGGRKGVLPGVSGLETIYGNHKLKFHPQKGRGMSPLSVRGSSGLTASHGNPIDEDMLEAAALAHPDFLLNVIADNNGKYVKVVTGNYLTAYMEGCRFVVENFGIPIKERADLAIASEGTNPRYTGLFGLSFMFSHANMCVKEGGTIILLADWTEEMAREALENQFKSCDLDRWEQELRKNFTNEYSDGLLFSIWCLRRNVIFISSLPDDLLESMGLIPAHSMEQALSIAYGKEGRNPRTYIIPHAITCAPLPNYVFRP